jgi:uncharacterized protein (TIGR03382 family)
MRAFSIAALILTFARPVAADECRTVDVTMVPADDLQIVAWIEDEAGTYVDTVFITQTTGLRGLGNRTGPMGANSGPGWPYGRRLGVFPVWAHAHGHEFPAVVFQRNESGDPASDMSINEVFTNSSREPFYCRPMLPEEPMWDAMSCASVVFTDKGKLSETSVARYPPRSDLVPATGDHETVEDFAALNPFDAVSGATPVGGVPFRASWLVPLELPPGNYVVRVEVSKEFDHNATFHESRYPPLPINFGGYGLPYRGQPSVVYQAAFTIGPAPSLGGSSSYAGYGDPDGLDGNLRAPDDTITIDVEGSGAQRLLAMPANGGNRIRVDSAPGVDAMPPGAISDATVTRVDATSAGITFVEAGDDGALNTVRSYEVRYRVGPITEETFENAVPWPGTITPIAPGHVQAISLDGLQPRMQYTIGIRAVDDCLRKGPLVTIGLITDRASGEVGACGCASADAGAAAPLLLALLVRLRRRRPR